MTAISSQKNWFTAIWSTKKMLLSYLQVKKNWLTAISRQKNSFAAIWREQKVGPCYLDTKICSSQLFRARKTVSQ